MLSCRFFPQVLFHFASLVHVSYNKNYNVLSVSHILLSVGLIFFFAGLAFRVSDSFLLLGFIFLVHESYRPIIIFSVPESNIYCPQIGDILSQPDFLIQ